MHQHSIRTSIFLLLSLLYTATLTAQVQVRYEPRHKNIFENQYLRLLDVWIAPGDTTQFHIHATPSLFLHFSNTLVGSQILGEPWVADRNTMGNASYRSFANDTLVHRVSNADTAIFHVTDIELLSAYKPATPLQPLPFTVIFNNEKAIAYAISPSAAHKTIISHRGPMVAQHVHGPDVLLHEVGQQNLIIIKAGTSQYLAPEGSYYLTTKGSTSITMVLFEIK